MGLKAKWTITCDNCKLIVERERTPEEGEEKHDGVHTTYIDEWGRGIPDGWLQIPFDKVTNKHYLFFHNDECFKNWLRSQNRMSELKEFENSIWMA